MKYIQDSFFTENLLKRLFWWYIHAPKTKSLQGIVSLHSAAATETSSASLCITIILKCDHVEHRDAKISSICCIFICAQEWSLIRYWINLQLYINAHTIIDDRQCITSCCQPYSILLLGHDNLIPVSYTHLTLPTTSRV